MCVCVSRGPSSTSVDGVGGGGGGGELKKWVEKREADSTLDASRLTDTN